MTHRAPGGCATWRLLFLHRPMRCVGALQCSSRGVVARSLTDDLAAIGTYLVLQEATRWLLVRAPATRKLVKEQRALLVWDGQMLQDRMQEAKVTEDEIRAAIRRAGKASLSEVQGVILENDGEWSVVPRSNSEDFSAFEGLHIPASLQR